MAIRLRTFLGVGQVGLQEDALHAIARILGVIVVLEAEIPARNVRSVGSRNLGRDAQSALAKMVADVEAAEVVARVLLIDEHDLGCDPVRK